MKKRTATAVLAALLVFGGVFAMAAGLGGITSTEGVGAENVALTSCDSDGVTTSYTTAWDGTDNRYEISTVTVSGVAAACDGQTLSVSLTGTTGQIGSGTLPIPSDASTSFDVTLGTAASAKDATGVHVLITS